MLDRLAEAGLAILAAVGDKPKGPLADDKPGSVGGLIRELFDFRGETFWVLVAFVLFIAIVWWKAGKSITGALDARAARIKQEIDQAEKLREEAQALLADYQRKQRDALAEAAGMIRQAEDEAKRLRAKAEAELDAALKRRERQALDRIAQAEAQALAEVRNLAADLAIAATRRVLVERLDAAQANALIDDAIAEVPKRLQEGGGRSRRRLACSAIASPILAPTSVLRGESARPHRARRAAGFRTSAISRTASILNSLLNRCRFPIGNLLSDLISIQNCPAAWAISL
jgi:F-type H+-transporting ATPase subunit b